ncbi:hypothetical protein Tsubulata_006723 [Turnera subulata]|uniref:MSP domain-containing protein n=1 Tax=Turnera subulata TaxID=218843 RepID=A0A9Q0GIY4_9ROSI|nr:hypothetical protein Tsubulata_006723 [Turnera subulata]
MTTYYGNEKQQQQQLLQIQPKELKFVFELKKQSTCLVRLTNNTYHHVAFKVKTTSPKSYCVRPNVGIIEPKAICEFTVTMQAQKVAPPDMICKDKFLIQSAVVPAGTTDKDITPAMFVRDVGKHVNEVKLRVALVSPSESPVMSPINGVLKQGPFFEDPELKDSVINTVESFPPSHKVGKDTEIEKLNDQVFNVVKHVEMKPKKDVVDNQESKSTKPVDYKKLNDQVFNTEEIDIKTKDVNNLQHKLSEVANGMHWINEEQLNPVKDDKLKVEKETIIETQQKEGKDMDFAKVKVDEPISLPADKEQKLVSDIEGLKSKLGFLESKLNEAESTISKLTEERRVSIQERTKLQEELAMLKSGKIVKTVHVGFPLLFVVMVALISVVVGSLLHA